MPKLGLHELINRSLKMIGSRGNLKENSSPDEFIRSINRLSANLKTRVEGKVKGKKGKVIVGKKARGQIMKTLASAVANPEAEKTKRSQTRNRAWSGAAQVIGTGTNASQTANGAISAQTFANQVNSASALPGAQGNNNNKNNQNNSQDTSNDPTNSNLNQSFT